MTGWRSGGSSPPPVAESRDARHHPNARPRRDRASLYDDITARVIAELEAGPVPWVQPWSSDPSAASVAMPANAAAHRRYSEINVLILWGVIERAFPT